MCVAALNDALTGPSLVGFSLFVIAREHVNVHRACFE